MVTEVVLSALIKILLGPGVFYSKLDRADIAMARNTYVVLMNNIKFCLNFFCFNIRENIGPGVGSALIGQVARLQILRDFVDKDTKTESLANDLSTSNRKVGNGSSKRNGSGSQKANSKTSEGSADGFKIEFTWVALIVSGKSG